MPSSQFRMLETRTWITLSFGQAVDAHPPLRHAISQQEGNWWNVFVPRSPTGREIIRQRIDHRFDSTTCHDPSNALVQLQAHLTIARGARYRKVLGCCNVC